jgi:hypothetical protein
VISVAAPATDDGAQVAVDGWPGKIDQATERLALRATLTASHLLGLATGIHLRALRGHADPLVRLQARLEEAELKARVSLEVAGTLAARFGKIPERHRPYYSPAQRFRILEIRSLLGWNTKDTAQSFLVCPNTILNWERSADPESQTVGSTVKPTPPVRRAADVVRAFVQTMTRLGLGGQDLMARTLARAGWRVSPRSVARYRKERTVPAPMPEDAPPQRPSRPVFTRFVHHTSMMDVSRVKQSLGPDLYMAAVFDAHSRVPLGIRLFELMPGAREMSALFRRTAKVFGKPKYLITDLGGEFSGGALRKAVKRIGTLHRFACADSIKATAQLERYWRTLKESAGLRGLQLALTVQDLERRLEVALVHYVGFRPHEGLRGATPLEVFLGRQPAHLNAIEPPRGGPGEDKGEAPFRVAFLDEANRDFPVLTLAE